MIAMIPTRSVAMCGHLSVVLWLGALTLPGCCREPITRICLSEPRIVLHLQERPDVVAANLSYDDLESHSETGFAYRGTGVLRLFENEIAVRGDHIQINGVKIGSLSEGYRNLILDRRGTVHQDRFLPFE